MDRKPAACSISTTSPHAIAEAREALDHRLLNEVEGLATPTLEHIAVWLWNRLQNRVPGLAEIEVARDSCQEGCIYRGPEPPPSWPPSRADPMGRKAPPSRTRRRVAHSRESRQGGARARRQPASRYALRRPLHGAGVHRALPGHRPARLRPSRHRLRAGPWLVESKSLKLYLASFRNHGAFHEDCTVAIGKRIAALLEPHYLRIGGYWYPRGGMPIDVFWQTGTLPKGVWLPDQGVAPYRGRG